MNGSGGDGFTAEARAALRSEVLRDGLVADDFLANDPDVPVFGFNLACLAPFPDSVAAAYRETAARLQEVDSSAYVYPLWQTHVTLATFASFIRCRRPDAAMVARQRSLIEPVMDLVRAALADGAAREFGLSFGSPVLSRKAVLLPGMDPTGFIAGLRLNIAARIARNPGLNSNLAAAGLNIPGIIHSTVMRFRRPPADLAGFLEKFDAAAAAAAPFTAGVNELLLTTETRPYMRAGEILFRFPLVRG